MKSKAIELKGCNLVAGNLENFDMISVIEQLNKAITVNWPSVNGVSLHNTKTRPDIIHVRLFVDNAQVSKEVMLLDSQGRLTYELNRDLLLFFGDGDGWRRFSAFHTAANGPVIPVGLLTQAQAIVSRDLSGKITPIKGGNIYTSVEGLDSGWDSIPFVHVDIPRCLMFDKYEILPT
jgi:hypothetical protein